MNKYQSFDTSWSSELYEESASWDSMHIDGNTNDDDEKYTIIIISGASLIGIAACVSFYMLRKKLSRKSREQGLLQNL